MEFLKALIINLIDGILSLICWTIFYTLLPFTPMFETALIAGIRRMTGIEINNPYQPWGIKVHNRRFYARLIAFGELGWMESYMDGWWDCEDIVKVIVPSFFTGKLLKVLSFHPVTICAHLKGKLFNLQTMARSSSVAERHYDLGLDLFLATVDNKTMNYSSGYWKEAKDLESSQIANMELVAQKLHLRPGMKILNIGTGYGGIEKHLAENYGASVIGYTISKQMAFEAQKRCAGLDVTIHCKDYREVTGKFDRIISLEMIEQVGPKNFRIFFKIANRCLVDDGLFLLQATLIDGPDSIPSISPFYDKWLFPNSYAPRLPEIVTATRGLFILEDYHNFGHNVTCKHWEQKFVKNWPRICDKYDEKYYRFWRYYFLGSAALYEGRATQLSQFVFSKASLMGGYIGVR